MLRIRIKVVLILDPAFHFEADPDPAFHFDADTIRILPFTLMQIRISPLAFLQIWTFKCSKMRFRIQIQLPKMMRIRIRNTYFNCKFFHVLPEQIPCFFQRFISESPLVQIQSTNSVFLLGTNNSRQLRRRAIHLQHCPGLQSVCR